MSKIIKEKKKSRINPDKARAYLKEYATNGFNKTGALDRINPNAQYKSNNQHSTEFHAKVINSDVPMTFSMEKITPEYIIEGITREIKNAVKIADRMRGYELLGKFRQIFNDNIKIQTNIYNTTDIKGLERLQSIRDIACKGATKS